MTRVLGEFILFVLVGMAVGQTSWGRQVGQPILDGIKWLFKWAKEATTGDATAK
jgi:hypothetical protein